MARGRARAAALHAERVSASSAPKGSSRRSSGLADERASDRHALRLAAGERRRPRVGACRRCRPRRARAIASSRRPRAAGSPMITLRQTRRHGSRRWSWKTIAALGRRLDDALGLGVEPGEGAQDRALAGAARAEQRDELARVRSRGRRASSTARSPKRRPDRQPGGSRSRRRRAIAISVLETRVAMRECPPFEASHERGRRPARATRRRASPTRMTSVCRNSCGVRHERSRCRRSR